MYSSQHVSPLVVEKLLNQKAGDVSEMQFATPGFGYSLECDRGEPSECRSAATA